MILGLIALAAASQTALPASESYRVVGENAPWTLTIADGRLTYEAPGRAAISESVPAPENDNGMISYRTARARLSIIPGVTCQASDGRRYTDSVFVTIGREQLAGCGGTELPEGSLAGTSWLFVEIDGVATELTGELLRDDRFMIDFHVGGFVGYGGCNRFSAGYSQDGDVVTTREPWGRGARNCGPAVTGRETRLLEILAAPVRISHADPDMMVLTGERGTVRLRRVN